MSYQIAVRSFQEKCTGQSGTSIMTKPDAEDVSESSGEESEALTADDIFETAMEKGEVLEETQHTGTNYEVEGPILLEEENDTFDKESYDDDDLEENQLTEDVYSLIFTTPFKSAAFVFAIFVFMFQMTLIILVVWDLLDNSRNDSNPLNVPPGTSIQVQVALALALLLAVATQGDLIAALVMLQQGYHSQVLEISPSATMFKWLLSCLLQMLAGVALLITIFVLCVQSSTVIGMMLNFAALSFISEIDDVAFMMAQHGFISDRLEQEANHVVDLKVPAKKTSKTLRRLMFLVIYAGLMAGYGIIIHQQRSGKFLCQSIFVQFGDGFTPYLPAFSGIYDQTDSLINGRVAYLERRSNQAMIAYCDDKNAWTFTWWLPDDDQNVTANPCYWFAKSPETESYDVTTTTDSTWVVNDFEGSTIKPQPFGFFVLQCVDCDGSGEDACNGRGKCKDNQCDCDEGWFGTGCEFFYPCPDISVDRRSNSFPENDFAFDILSDNYILLTNDDGNFTTVYEKPVYVYQLPDDSWSVMMFTGRRWIVTDTFFFSGEFLFNDIPTNATRSELASFLTGFHAFYDGVRALFVSDAMDVGTPSEAFTPIGLGWYHPISNNELGKFISQIDLSKPTGTNMLCDLCGIYPDSDCFVGGYCDNTTDTCICAEGFEGALCELDTSLVP